MMKYAIRINRKEKKFEAVDENDVLLGIINYTIDEDKFLIITHTIVESDFEGQGIAAALNKAALIFAKENEYRVIPECTYTKSYINKHPEFSSLIVN